MTEQEYKEEVNKIVKQAITVAENCSRDVEPCTHGERTEGTCPSAVHKHDCASDIACELAGEHPWLQDVDKCFEMLKISPKRDEIFHNEIYFISEYIAKEDLTFAKVMSRMAEEAFWFDVAEVVQDRAPEEVKEAWRIAEEEEERAREAKGGG